MITIFTEMTPHISIYNVEYDVFAELCHRLKTNFHSLDKVNLFYDGSALKGDITIRKLADYQEEYKIAIKEFANIYCK